MKDLSLKIKLLIPTIICLVIMVGSMLWLSVSSLRANIQETLNRDIHLFATSFAESIEDWISDRRNSLKQLTEVLPANPDVPPHIFLDLVTQGLDLSLAYMGTEDGDMYRNNPNLNPEGYDPRVRSWYKGVMANQDSFITSPYTSASTGDLVITIAEPIFKNGRITSVVGGNVTLDTLTQNVNALDVPGNGYAILIDENNKLVAHPDASWQRKPAADFSPNFAPDKLAELTQSANLVIKDVANKESALHAVNVPGTGWTMVLVMDNGVLMAPVRKQLMVQLGTAVVIIGAAIVVLLGLFKVVFRGLEGLSQTLNEIASGRGDLTRRLHVDSNDDIGRLSSSFNRFVEQLHGIISRLVSASEELNNQANNSAKSVDQQLSRVQRHKTEIDMVANAVREMATATQEIAANAERTRGAALQTVDLSKSGVDMVGKSQESIKTLAEEVSSASSIIAELNQHAQKITSILSTITGISEQTNLLALNAAIEAARAGEHGRGFAVVADEVRLLSSRTHDSTKEIETMISALSSATHRAVVSMDKGAELASLSVADAAEANNSLVKIGEAIDTINDMAAQIASAAEEQAAVTIEINRNTDIIKSVGEEMAGESQNASAAASRLRELGGRVHEDISRFTI